MIKSVFFDLDGTLTDSSEGIINCAMLAFDHFGITIENRDDLRVIIGPPLRHSMVQFGVPEDRADEAVEVFRSRYNTVGKFENFPYPGIPELLERLKAAGIRMFIATSKPEKTANEVLAHFNLSQYFEEICGSTMDGTRSSKEDVITYLFSKIGSVDQVVMVGDTTYDVLGAAAHGIKTIGVSWGFGEVADMQNAGAIAIANTTDELYDLIIN